MSGPEQAPATAIVVGAGSAGCVVAATLAAAGYTVTILEAGPASVAAASRSANWVPIQGDPERTWPQRQVRRFADGPLSGYLIGRGRGGSSAINAMLAEVPAVVGSMWGPLSGTPSLRSAHGEVLAALGPFEQPEIDPTGRRLLSMNLHHTSADQEARTSQRRTWHVAPVELTMVEGERRDAASVFLDPHLEAGTVTILGNQEVRSVGPAIGGQPWVQTTKDRYSADIVVLSAGALASPELLHESGIEGRNIGVGLGDHPSVAIPLTGEVVSSVAHSGPPITVQAERQLSGGGVGRVLAMASTETTPAQLLVGLMTPTSQGRCGRGVAEFNQLSTPADQQQMIELIGAAKELARSVFGQDDTGPPAQDLTHWMTQPGGYSHAVASCRVGITLDRDGGVLDPRGARYPGLHVIDAGAFAAVPPLNPNLATMVLARAMASNIAPLPV